MMPRRLALLALSSVLLGGCAMFVRHEEGAQPKKDIGLDKAIANLTPADKVFLDNQPRFAVRLGQSSGMAVTQLNLCVSPLATEHALAMILNGAQGDSFDACAKVLGLNDPRVDKFNIANSRCLDVLASQKGTPLHLANSIWNVQPIRFNKAFEADMDKFYSAEISKLGSVGVGATSQLNDWVKDRTNGAIPKIIEKLSPEFATIIINALHFDAKWAGEFAVTEPMEFTSPTGKVMVPMEQGEVACKTVVTKEFCALTIPYSSGSLSMTFVLPTNGETPGKILSDHVVSMAMDRSLDSKVEVTFPRFKVDQKHGMRNALSKMGGSMLFERKNDFSLMSHELRDSGVISQFMQVIKFETDEKGSRGATATSVEHTKSDSVPEKFVIDRPFLFFVWESHTKSILFLGVVNDPSKT